MSLGQRIKLLREKLGLSQEQLGERLGVSFQAVSGWERDINAPDTGRLLRLAEALKTSVAGLMGERQYTLDWDMEERLFHEDRMYTFVKSSAAAKGLLQTQRALPFARDSHLGQVRKGKAGIPYISHPLTMCCQALALGLDEDRLLAAILLHDVVEDCGVSPEELPFDAEVRETVRLLSKDPGHEADEEGYDKVYFEAISGHPHAMFIKLLDRCHNLSVMSSGFTRERMLDYIAHTQRFVMPLSDTLRKMAPRYSDACFLLKYQMLSLMHLAARLIMDT